MHPLPVKTFRHLVVGALAALLITAVACDEPFGPTADTPNLDVTIEAWALTGSPSNYPTVHLVAQRLTVRPDAQASFDIGFDIDSAGRLLVLPVSKVVSSTLGNRRVGIIRTDSIYNLITEAPRTGWIFDSTLSVNVGQVFLVRVQTQYCSGFIDQEVYAKYHVDSVNIAERFVKLSGRVNPNCGFRSWRSGIPKF